VEFDETLFNQEQERVESEYIFSRVRSNIENPDGSDNGTAPDGPSTPDEHDVVQAKATVTGEDHALANDQDGENFRFRVTLENSEGNDVPKHEAESSATAQANAPGFIEAGSVKAHIFDRHGEIVLVDDGANGFDTILDANGDPIPSTVVAFDSAGANSIDYTWDNGGFSFTTKEFHSVEMSFSQTSSTHPSGPVQNITSQYLHPDCLTAGAGGSFDGATNWNGFIDRDILNTTADGTTNHGVDAGDVVTYGIFIENLGSQAVYDIKLEDQIFQNMWALTGNSPTASGGVVEAWANAVIESTGANGGGSTNPLTNGNSLSLPTAGLIDVTTVMQNEVNLNVTRGDGTPIDFTAFYNASSGELELEIGDSITSGTNGVALQGGRSVPSGALDNVAGTNVLVVTYDIELADDWKALDRMTNVAEVTEYSIIEDGAQSQNMVKHDLSNTGGIAADADDAGLRDEAIIEAKGVDINKVLLATDQAFTDDYRSTEASYTEQNDSQVDHAYDATTQTQTSGDDKGTDVAVGEVVTYGLIVRVPEGTTQDLAVIDQLPDGLEFISARLVTGAADLTGSPYTAAHLQAQSSLTSTEFDLRATRGGATDYAGDATAAGGSTLAIANMPTAGDTGVLSFRLGTVVNAHDAEQDSESIGNIDTLTGHESTGTSPIEILSHTASSERNDIFMIEVHARVLNDLEYNPAANGHDPSASSTADLQPTNGDPTPAGSPVDATGSPAGNQNDADLTNEVKVQFTRGDDGTAEEVASDTSVTVDIVEPNLQILKTHNETDNITELGKTVTYTLTISHTGTSTSDAFDVNLLDNMSLNSLLAQSDITGTNQVTISEVRITSAPSYLATGNIVTNGAAVTPPAGVTDNSNLAIDEIDITLDRVELGDSVTVQYEVFIGGETAAADIEMVTDVTNAGTDAPTSTTDPGADIRNRATLTYYSVTDLTNVEVREYQTSDTADLDVRVPQIELNLVKGVLAVSPLQPSGQDFAADTTANISGAGSATGTGEDSVWNSGGLVNSAFLHPNLGTDLAWSSAVDRDVINGTNDMGVDAFV
ncbi:MAG: hypothetical protein AAF226_06105, partial [Verrucomicrobiota bacterium]